MASINAPVSVETEQQQQRHAAIKQVMINFISDGGLDNDDGDSMLEVVAFTLEQQRRADATVAAKQVDDNHTTSQK